MLLEGLRHMLNTTSAGGSAGVQHLPEGLPGPAHLCCLFLTTLEEGLGDTSTSSAGGLLWFPSGDDLLGDEWLPAAGPAEDQEQAGPAVGHLKSGSSGGLWKAVDSKEGLVMSLESSYRLDGPDGSCPRSGQGPEDTQLFARLL